MAGLPGWSSRILTGSVVGGIGLACYFVIVQPYMHPEKWQEIQKKTREGIDREKIQPGGMKIWTDPFDKGQSKK